MTQSPSGPERSLRGFALRLALGYALVGVLYIATSDRILEMLVSDPVRLTRIQSYKGWAFVAITACLLFVVCRRFVRSVESSSRELTRALATQRRLTSELNHRVRNNLASLVAIIGLTSNDRPGLREFAASIVGRIRAMDAAYSMLSEGKWRPVPFRSVVAAATEYFESCRELEGPEALVQVDQIVPLLLVLHELSSNAQRHGSARTHQGKVRIHWTVGASSGGAGELIMIWTEQGESSVTRPAEHGVGLQMALGMTTSDLQGHLEVAWQPTGVEYTLKVPLGGPGGPSEAGA